MNLTSREMVLLTVLSDMYGAPLDLVAQMLGVSESRAYRIVRKLRKAKVVSELGMRPVPGPSWITPTRSTADALLGRSTKYWMPSPKMANHTRTVLEVRLALVGMDLERWISERQLRSEVAPAALGETRPHIHDGRYINAAGELIAVEVELTDKNLKAAKTAVSQAFQAARAADCAGLIYYYRGERVKAVITKAAAELQAAGLFEHTSIRMRLADLDTELLKPRKPASPDLRPGLRVIAGGAADHNTQVTDPNEHGEAVSS
ncbi:hypothetical protein [Nocardia mangyaensis]|uniref:hypothetical protein n=1 Tax=Nocardia mangyaensis TaxID=2213200 RepID=UPI0026761FDB|nr:hypothetical protein [Nocardia mangyaensis]MDO3648662.1 hypothetical protein [Nocardia mangyaensis]